MHERAVPFVTAINSFVLLFFAAAPGRNSNISSAVSCESELRELFDTRALLHTYRQLCFFLLSALGILGAFVWLQFFESGRRPVRVLFGKGGKGKLQ